MSDLLALLGEYGGLTAEQSDLVIRTQEGSGGSVLRTLERVIQDVPALWATMAEMTQRRCYSTPASIETLEAPLKAPGKEGFEPLLSRSLALEHLCVAQRVEWDTLCLLTVDPLPTISAELQARANAVSPTGQGRIRFSLIAPELFRLCLRLTYPTALYGGLTFAERLCVSGLVGAEALDPYEQEVQEAVDAGLVTEADYADALAAHLRLPRYAYAPIRAPAETVPLYLRKKLGVLPHSVEGGVLTLLVTRMLTEEDRLHLERFSGKAVTYQVTSPSELRALIRSEEDVQTT
ncbi:hypothetical protein [Deinococcus sp. Leaf326]|uniref:hypothetical protein n=1 Tax=Deinococcus sp. Leaf326 TaxID=1736338 RepID=UPI000B070481|nr:hypothetical protein [Deinococcus sp. Leaf326]